MKFVCEKFKTCRFCFKDGQKSGINQSKYDCSGFANFVLKCRSFFYGQTKYSFKKNLKIEVTSISSAKRTQRAGTFL
jgi:hypothetical protein